MPSERESRLVYLNESDPHANLTHTGVNYPDFVAWRDHTRAFERMALYDFGDFNIMHRGSTERLRGMRVSRGAHIGAPFCPLAVERPVAAYTPSSSFAICSGVGSWPCSSRGSVETIR